MNVYNYNDGSTPNDNKVEYNIVGKSSGSTIRWGSYGGAIPDANSSLSEFSNNLAVDPKMIDPDNQDFTLAADSPAIDAGQYMTLTDGSSSSSSTALKCDDVLWVFSGPYAPWSIAHDDIKPDNSWVEREVRGINYSSKTITLDSPAIWDNNTPIYYRAFAGSAPDIGAYEYRSPGKSKLVPPKRLVQQE